MKYDSEYYLLRESVESGSYMLDHAEDSDEGLDHLMSLRSINRRVLGLGVVEISDGDVANFSPCDYHETPEQLVSEKFKNIITKFNLPGIDFYKTNIINGDVIWKEHYFMHIWNHHKAIHHGRSKIDGTYVDDDFTLEVLSLDENVLDKIPLEKRLIFTLEEKPKFLFHETVVQALREANLTGLSFQRVDEWSIGSAFE
ncbi:hypothetical protein KCG43_20975 [Photobacterium sp. WH24]|uniref:imm11 family protein n=1 Tax=Photobacterium sp. WH24 TaxID=2827237 RepID=UPI001C48FB0A|nr:DUF1629 domain-containing protein [Photobacterium sp. WH24]MBV7264490.1 hypothetical protein [Photobacterium sp. WH24]